MNSIFRISLTLAVIFLTTSLYSRDSQEGNKVLVKNEKFLRKEFKKISKGLNSELGFVLNVESLNWATLNWKQINGNECELKMEITYKDVCESVKAQFEVTLLGAGFENSARLTGERKKDDVKTEADDITKLSFSKIVVFMPRCEDGKRMSNSYNLKRVDANKSAKGKYSLKLVILE
jgi:hypothetical protein